MSSLEIDSLNCCFGEGCLFQVALGLLQEKFCDLSLLNLSNYHYINKLRAAVGFELLICDTKLKGHSSSHITIPILKRSTSYVYSK